MYTHQYDDDFEGAVLAYWPQCPSWKYLKAQAIAESLLDPLAQSSAGAKGLMQFLDGTFAEVAAKLNFPNNATPFMPQYAITAGAFYMHERWQSWSNPNRTGIDRMRLAWAAYNAGFGNLLMAQVKANGALDYDRIIAKLPWVTGADNAKQTKDYVLRIQHVYAELTA